MIYVGIPAHNEAATLGALLWKVRQVMADYGRDYEVWVVDDGSTDGTGDVLARYARYLPLEVLRHESRRGLGAALETLVRGVLERSAYPRRDVLVTVQADFSEDPGALPGLVKRIEGGADLVVGAVREGRALPPTLGWARAFARLVARRHGVPDTVTDPLSGYRAYRLVAPKRALPGGVALRCRSAAVHLELLLRAAPAARRIDEVPVTLRRDRLQRRGRYRAWPLWLELLRLWWRPPRQETAVVAVSEAGPVARDGARARRSRGARRRRRTGRARPEA